MKTWLLAAAGIALMAIGPSDELELSSCSTVADQGPWMGGIGLILVGVALWAPEGYGLRVKRHATAPH